MCVAGKYLAAACLTEQDREIGEKSGRPPLKIKNVTRSGAKKKARDLDYSDAG